MDISIIAALAKNNVIGNKGKVPWHISEDLKRFKALTSGHPIIMGRKTFEHDIGRPLPNRTNIVVTTDANYNFEGVVSANSLEEAIEKAKAAEGEPRPEGREVDSQEIFIIGGGKIYEQGIKYTNKLYLTIVDRDFEGDTFFPDYSEFKKTIFEQSGESEGLGYKFVELER
jgi:dihydrofolate reductase